jgi:hypothetical protein
LFSEFRPEGLLEECGICSNSSPEDILLEFCIFNQVISYLCLGVAKCWLFHASQHSMWLDLTILIHQTKQSSSSWKNSCQCTVEAQTLHPDPSESPTNHVQKYNPTLKAYAESASHQVHT